LFYAVDRYDSSFELRVDLEKYDYIIGNRYVSSSMIHQAGKIEDLEKLEDYLDWLYDLEYNVLALPKPEKVLFLDVTPEVSAKLLLKKEKRDYIKNSDNLDLHEADKNHLKNAYNRAVFVAEKYEDWIRIECTKNNEIKSRQKITQLILEQINKK
jgi:dTMP kinase